MEKLALISVFDKAGVVDFARALVERHGFRILSTGGTARLLKEEGLPVTDVSEHTGFPELMEGRVKTLHPLIHGGLLCRRDKPEHLEQAAANGIGMIDLVAVNLYPFEKTVAKPGVSFEEAIENIDIGGPSMLRSAAKNHQSVTVVCDAADYDDVLGAMDAEKAGDPGQLASLRRKLGMKVFQRTSAYDAAISSYLMQQGEEPALGALGGYPENFLYTASMAQKLRYGENPHQMAALYGSFHDSFEQLQGKELSYNNILDITAAVNLIGEFRDTTLAILKHTNPCGVATAETVVDAWEQALATDRQSPFGGIIIANRTVTGELAERIREIFCEIIIAPDFAEDALQIFRKKKNLRLMIVKQPQQANGLKEMRAVIGGVLVQDMDRKMITREECNVVTARQPTEDEWRALLFGWKVVKHVKSNAIVYAGAEHTLGIGAGQMSRVDSSKVAVMKAAEAGLSLKGSVIASDAFFPMADGLVAAAKAGCAAAIQPGGSIRDEEVIKAANDHDMAMVFTGVRHFKH